MDALVSAPLSQPSQNQLFSFQEATIAQLSFLLKDSDAKHII